ncbi:hypothetical protein M231_06503 [Tremella mesenterica]|uniref:TLC domain-containing protein n=1 Tax=Tremella mesenterica TaxID=5217 RepID=A0A4Q1BGB1_TREME|nr:hypothetical protein M231_06503 [Tremella mesenterica]
MPDFSSLFNLPIPLTLPIPLFIIFTITYLSFAPRFKTEKQKAYILSTLSSGSMTLISLPFLYTYLTKGFGVVMEQGEMGWMLVLGRFGVTFFATYLIADLVLGWIYYRNQVGLLTGWIHHLCYIALMGYILTTRLSPTFLIAASMELPTFDLAISNLFPSVRNDLRFLSTFFILRITFHLIFLLDCLRPSSRTITHSFSPGIFLTLALILHISWFRGGLSGYLKRRSKSLSKPLAQITEPIISAATNLEPTIENSTLPSSSSSPPTPEDSPLITPRTPSLTPFTLRDSYLLPNLPNLPQITMPNLPTVSIPSLSELTASIPRPNRISRELSLGFKDAVRSRWEEQRERFVAVKEMGMGMDLSSFSAMGIRRRRKAEEVEVQVVMDEED